jgi:hypothetical protein
VEKEAPEKIPIKSPGKIKPWKKKPRKKSPRKKDTENFHKSVKV